MPFNDEDKIIIKQYRLDKGYGVKRLLREFANKNRSKGGLRHFWTNWQYRMRQTGDRQWQTKFSNNWCTQETNKKFQMIDYS